MGSEMCIRDRIRTLEWVEWRFSGCSGIKGINGVKVGKDLRVKISGFYRFEGGDSKLDGEYHKSIQKHIKNDDFWHRIQI